jgi:hypothetical protein
MSLEVYYPQDILNALLAAEHASGAMAEAIAAQDDADDSQSTDGSQSAFFAGYATGYRAALTTLALAFGLVRYDGEPLRQYAAAVCCTTSPR